METIKELAFKLSKLDREIDRLTMEYNQTLIDIKTLLPKLKDDPNLEPKIRKKNK